MKLSEKGRFQPPPVLEGPSQLAAEAIAAWPDIHARTHWFLGDEQQIDGADFYVGERELGHIHLYAEAHIVEPLPVAEALIKEKLARPFRWSRSFIVFEIKSAADVDHALWLFRLNYDYLQGAPVSELLARIASYSRGRGAASKKPEGSKRQRAQGGRTSSGPRKAA